MRLATTSLLFMVIGCTGDAPNGGGGVDADIDPDPRTCLATLSTSGTFEVDASAVPGTGSGCKPWGTWTFTTAIVSNNCSPAPTASQYQFRVTQKLDDNGDPTLSDYAYLTDPTAEHRLKHSQGGSGLCAGELQLYSADGKTVFNLRPALNADNSITGDGEYAVFTTDQRPF